MSITALLMKAGHVVDVERNVPTAGAAGGRVPNWVPVKIDLHCWIQPINAMQADFYQRQGIIVSHRAYFIESPAVQANDRLLWRKGSITRYLLVKAIRNPGELDHHWAVDCQEQKT